jgi:hypothetical protein
MSPPPRERPCTRSPFLPDIECNFPFIFRQSFCVGCVILNVLKPRRKAFAPITSFPPEVNLCALCIDLGLRQALQVARGIGRTVPMLRLDQEHCYNLVYCLSKTASSRHHPLPSRSDLLMRYHLQYHDHEMVQRYFKNTSKASYL